MNVVVGCCHGSDGFVKSQTLTGKMMAVAH